MFARRVQNSYQKLLQENFRILDEEQVRRVAGMLNISKRVLILESEIPVMQRKNSSCVSCVSGWMLMQLQIPI